VTRKLGDLGLQDRMPRPEVVVPGHFEEPPSDEIPQPELTGPVDWSGREREHPVYPKPRGAMPNGYPTPTSPDNPNGAPIWPKKTGPYPVKK
jgi:hypothetical protein